MRKKSFSYTMFLFLGLYVLGGSLIPEEYRDYIFLAFIFIIPTFGRLVKNNARKYNRENEQNNTTSNPFYEQEEETTTRYAQNTVECPYCSHMNPDNLTFCEKCNGLL